MSADRNLLPRELAPDLLWLGDCLAVAYEGDVLHSYNSMYLVRGDDCCLLVDAGLTTDYGVTWAQLGQALAGAAPLRYIFLTHQETPHVGGVARLLEAFPDATAIGDVHDFHLFFPQLAHRFRTVEAGDEIDLGNNTFRVLAPVIRDLVTTLWGFATRQRALFSADGFAYAHRHRAGQCGRVAEEVPELPIAEMNGIFIEEALPWMPFVDIEPYAAALTELIEALDVRLVAPTHGLPILDVPAAMPTILRGLRIAGRDKQAGTSSAGSTP